MIIKENERLYCHCHDNRDTYTCTLTCVFPRACLAAASWQQNRFIAGRFRTFVFYVLTLHTGYNASLLVYRNALASKTVHYSERWPQVGKPCRA